MVECAACGTADKMLFICRHCQGKFCSAHVREHGCGADGSSPAGQRAQAAVGGGTAGTRKAAATSAVASSAIVNRGERAGGGSDPAPVRPMDSRKPPGTTNPHRPETVAEWLRQQTYLTLMVKVGGVALLVTLAFYAGLVFTLYDPLGAL